MEQYEEIQIQSRLHSVLDNSPDLYVDEWSTFRSFRIPLRRDIRSIVAEYLNLVVREEPRVKSDEYTEYRLVRVTITVDQSFDEVTRINTFAAQERRKR